MLSTSRSPTPGLHISNQEVVWREPAFATGDHHSFHSPKLNEFRIPNYIAVYISVDPLTRNILCLYISKFREFSRDRFCISYTQF